MAIVRIKNLPPYDGDHPLDVSQFTNRELHTIKRLSGVRGGELQDAFDAADVDLYVALCVIALERNGLRVGRQGEELIWDATTGTFVIDFSDDEDEIEEGDARPPEQPPSEPERSASDDARSDSSGRSSSAAGDPPENDQSRTGLPPSDTTSP